MNTKEFFELSTGKWFAHRTTQDISQRKSQETKSDIIIEQISSDHPKAIALIDACKDNSQKFPKELVFAVKIDWNDTTKLNQKSTGSTILVLLPNLDNESAGKWLQQSNKTDSIITGNYQLGDDFAFTLSAKHENFSLSERIWFASPNLRMRVNTINQPNGLKTAYFTSEIRMGTAPPEAVKVSEKMESVFPG